jgi:hypothetical protein
MFLSALGAAVLLRIPVKTSNLQIFVAACATDERENRKRVWED